jgi:hypothetical protein
MTISEQHFEAFCRQADIDLTRLPETDLKTADYSVVIGGQRVIAEIKEINANEDDLRAHQKIMEEQCAVWGTNKVGSRIRYKIDAAKRQIERLTAGTFPGIIVLYDARPELVRGVWPYEVLVAMYGNETIDLHISKCHAEPVRFGVHRFGKGKKLRHDSHTYISALAVLRETANSDHFHMDFFLNVFADYPLPIEHIVHRSDMTVFTITPEKGNKFANWTKIIL